MNTATLTKLMSHGYELDNDGQIVIYTGYYEHDDGTISTEPQDGYDEEEED
jgi:hypothetical protein